jgi:DNA processing protein
VGLAELLQGVRTVPPSQAARLRTKSMFSAPADERGATLYFAGDASLVTKKLVAVVGSRDASPVGKERAGRLARELAARGIVVVSGLAEGIDTAAHTAAIEAGGRTIAVIGTPLDRAFPATNAALQETIWREHLLLSPFPNGAPVHKSNFPHRNKIMAALSDATVIVEASDTSGSLHQAAECLRIGRWLFIPQSLVQNTRVSWPAKFLDSAQRGARVKVLSSVDDVLEAI